MKALGTKWFVMGALMAVVTACEGPTRDVGDACEVDVQCGADEAAWCLPEREAPGGYCTQSCTDSLDCPSNSVCVRSGTYGICLATCSNPGSPRGCRTSYQCYGLAGEDYGVCAPKNRR